MVTLGQEPQEEIKSLYITMEVIRHIAQAFQVCKAVVEPPFSLVQAVDQAVGSSNSPKGITTNPSSSVWARPVVTTLTESIGSCRRVTTKTATATTQSPRTIVNFKKPIIITTITLI